MSPSVTGFQAFSDPMTWTGAKSACESKGMTLAKITPENIASLPPLSSTQYWVGASDQAVEGQWKWTDGSAVSGGVWNGNEPNDHGGGEDCAVIISSSKKMNDVSCSQQRGYICCGPDHGAARACSCRCHGERYEPFLGMYAGQPDNSCQEDAPELGFEQYDSCCMGYSMDMGHSVERCCEEPGTVSSVAYINIFMPSLHTHTRTHTHTHTHT